MAESVGVSFADENDFQKEGKWYILSSSSQFEACSTVSSSHWRAYQILVKILCQKRAVIQVVFLRTMVAQATQTVIIIRNPRHQQFFHPSIEKSRVVAILHSRDRNYKA